MSEDLNAQIKENVDRIEVQRKEIQQLTDENAKLDMQRKQYKEEFEKMSTYLYFILNQLGDYVQGTGPYNMNKTLNTHRILRTKDFSLDCLLKACDRLQLGSDFIVQKLWMVQNDLETYFAEELAKSVTDG